VEFVSRSRCELREDQPLVAGLLLWFGKAVDEVGDRVHNNIVEEGREHTAGLEGVAKDDEHHSVGADREGKHRIAAGSACEDERYAAHKHDVVRNRADAGMDSEEDAWLRSSSVALWAVEVVVGVQPQDVVGRTDARIVDHGDVVSWEDDGENLQGGVHDFVVCFFDGYYHVLDYHWHPLGSVACVGS
jgi:hypothetical protein